MKNVLAAITGLMVAAILTYGIESLSAILFPFPEGVDPMDMEWLKNNTDVIPSGALIVVGLAHLIGIVCGMLVAGLISKTSMIPAYVVGVLMLAGTIANIVMIPHPAWFSITDLIGALIGISMGRKLASIQMNES